ncbi:MAG: M16 family metallopeptidase [Candidatus Aminicenantaceae bacterium]
MIPKRWILLILCLIAALAFQGPIAAQDPTHDGRAGQIGLDQKPPIDPKVTVGQLDNGLRYFIRENTKPENRAELRLVVNAGSILEDEDQQGLAHFVEHMAFNGSRNFAKQELVEFMESIGMRFGPELNAYTGFDETVYMLTIPSDNPETTDTAFQILEDWAHELAFEDEEIDKERGVIIEEWRLGQGAMSRLRDKQFPVLLKNSHYAERLPIGQKKILESFAYDVLKRFYREWYRPDLMAVIAVGDFDKAEIEKRITEHFQGLKNPENARARTAFQVPDHNDTLITIATDKEVPYTSVAVYHKLPPQAQSTVGAYRQSIVERIYSGMLNRRFSELTQKPDPPFIYAFSGRGSLVRTKDSYTLTTSTKEDGIERGLRAVLTEAERVARFGFTATELDRQKQDLLRSVERAFTERENQNSGIYAAEYIRSFLQGEPIPGIAFEFELHKRFVPEITLEEINRLGKEWTSQGNRVVLVSAPEKEGLSIPSEVELRTVLASQGDADIQPYEDTVSDEPLMAVLPEPAGIVSTSRRDDLNITEWQLANGVRVILMPTEHKTDEILFRAISPGGASLASDADHIPAQTAAQVIGSSGLGSFNPIELRKKLTGTVAVARPFISQLEEGVSGSASPKDLETMFQLIHLTFTAPRADVALFQSLTSRMKAQLANRMAMPEAVFFDTFLRILIQDHPRALPMTVETVDKMNLDRSLAFYRDRFGDAGDFTFIFVGNIDPGGMEALVRQYLATLPTTGRKETWKDLEIRPPKGVIKRTVRKGIEPKSMTAIAFTGPFQYDADHRNALRALCTVMDTRLRNALREDRGGTYGVGIRPSYERIPVASYDIMINFGADPERMEELSQVVFDEIERIKAEGPTEEEVRNIKEAEIRSFETSAENNGWWLSQLVFRYRSDEDPGGLLTFKESLEKLDREMIQEAARTYFNTENTIQVTLLPEEKK